MLGVDLGDPPALAVVDVLGAVVGAGNDLIAGGEPCFADFDLPLSADFVEYLREELGYEDLARVLELFRREGITFGSGGPQLDEPTWTVRLNKEIRRFRSVTTVDDYLAIRYQAAAEIPPAVAPPPYTAIPGPVVMPTGQPGYDLGTMHPLVRDAAAALFAGGHYREGVLKAAVALRDLIRAKSGLNEPDDSTLMGKALGGKAPVIVVADLSTETGRNVQRGTAHLAHGILARLRNPLTHEIVELDHFEAIEMLAVISRVTRDVDAGTADASAVVSVGVRDRDAPAEKAAAEPPG